MNTGGHTYNNLISSAHYKNLSKICQKLGTIVTKVCTIISSISDASGIEIEKIKKDLNSVKKAINSVKTSTSDRMIEMEARARIYDEAYKLLEEKCNKKQFIASTAYSTGAGYAGIFIWVRRYDTLHKTELYYDKVSWDSDGMMILTIRYVETEVHRENKNLNGFSAENDILVEDEEPNKVVEYTRMHKVVVIGNEVRIGDQIPTFTSR